MSTDSPGLQGPGVSETRDAKHAHSKILGDWLKACRPKRKHWWHASLRPTLPGGKIPGQDPDDEESSDQQMNFGFTFGDEFITEAYFYVTAYPLPEAFNHIQMPGGTDWCTEGFTGAVARYRTLRESEDPEGCLLNL